MRGPRLICEDFILTLRSSIHNPIFLSAFLPLNLLSIFRNFVSLAGPFKSFPGKHFARHCAGRRPEHSNPPAGGYARLEKCCVGKTCPKTPRINTAAGKSFGPVTTFSIQCIP